MSVPVKLPLMLIAIAAGTSATLAESHVAGRFDAALDCRLDLAGSEETPVLFGALQEDATLEAAGEAGRVESALPPEESWTFQVTPFLWLITLDGTAKIRGQEFNVDVNIFDILDEADSLFAVPVHVDARYGKWGLFVEPNYTYIKFETNVADLTIQMLFLELGGSYRLIEEPMGETGRNWWLEGLAGCRYSYLDLDIEPVGSPDVGMSEDWFDPFIGVRSSVPLAERWSFDTRADVGGFDVGCDFTWHALAAFRYRLGARSELRFGYRALDQRYSPRSGGLWDVTMHGPIIGLQFEF